MSFAPRSRSPLFAGLERWLMSLREGNTEPGLPTSHYFLSLSRGDAIRTVMLRPAGLWALAALAAVLFVWSAAAAAYLVFHDDLMGAMVARQAAMESAYESRLAEARARLDEVGGQRALDLKSFARKLSELASRQARLEKRGAVVAALAAESEGRNPSAHEGRPAQASPVPADALGAIRALGPPLPAEGDAGSARAYAPLPGLRTRKETIALTAADSLRRRAALAARPDSIVT
jgi:hypothetical protein